MPGFVCFQKLRDVGDERIVGVGVSQKGTDGKKNLGNGQCRTPLVLQNVKTNSSVGIDVTVVDPGSKMDLGWLEWVISWKVNV